MIYSNYLVFKEQIELVNSEMFDLIYSNLLIDLIFMPNGLMLSSAKHLYIHLIQI